MKNPLLVVLVIIGLVSGVSCGEAEEPVPTHTIYGTATSSTVDASNRLVWIKLVQPEGTAQDIALYYTSCLLIGPACDYKINFVPEGEYTVFAVIDMNANISDPELVPDSGDLVSAGKPIWLWEKTKADFIDSNWRRIP